MKEEEVSVEELSYEPIKAQIVDLITKKIQEEI